MPKTIAQWWSAPPGGDRPLLLVRVRAGFAALLTLCLLSSAALCLSGPRSPLTELAIPELGIAALAWSSIWLWRRGRPSLLLDLASAASIAAVAAQTSDAVGIALLFATLQFRALYGRVRSAVVGAAVYVGLFLGGDLLSGGHQALTFVLEQAPAALGLTVVLSLVGCLIDDHEQGSRARLALLVDASSDVLLIIDVGLDADSEYAPITYASPAVTSLIGSTPRPGCLAGLVHPQDLGSLHNALGAVRRGELDALTIECRMGCASHGWRDVELSAQDHSRDRHLHGVVCTVHDVTERNKLHAGRLDDAMHDAATGLVNRYGLVELLDRWPVECSAVLVRCDLGDTRRLGDYLGHQVGDALLVAIAAELSTAAGPGAVVAKPADDEFAIVLPCPALEHADLAGYVTAVLSRVGTVELAQAQVPLRVRAGFTRLSNTGHGTQTLRDATIALAEARRTGVALLGFHESMSGDVLARLALETDLRLALRAGQLELVYQPVVTLETGLLASAEALVRWNRPGFGVVSPTVFIPVAEATGLIVDLGSWVMQEACRQAGEWRRAGTPVRVAVNVAAAQLEDDGFTEVVAAALLDADLPPRLLVIEVTESAIVASTLKVAETLAGLRSIGIRISLDDFGTGYSSLAYLHHLPVDTVKIDQSFVQDLGSDDGSSEVLIHSIVALAASLGLATVAEGIEKTDHVDFLRGVKATYGQGYLFDRPLSASGLATTWLRDAPPPDGAMRRNRPPARPVRSERLFAAPVGA